MNRKNRKYIIPLAIIIVYAIVMVVVFILNNKGPQVAYIALENSELWKYENEKWTRVSPLKYKDFNWKEFQVYSDSKSIGKYSLMFHKEWYVFDKHKQAVSHNGIFLATHGTIPVKVKSFETELNMDTTDEYYIQQALEDYGIDKNFNFHGRFKVKADIDGDGKMEYIYTIGNIFPSEEDDQSTFFSIVFLRKEDKIYTIYRQKTKDVNKAYEACSPYLGNMISVDGKKYNIILNCEYFSTTGLRHLFYEFDSKNGEVKPIKLVREVVTGD